MAADPALLYRLPAADAASLAFGRLRTNALDKVAHADRADGAAAWAMTLATGYTTVAGYLNGPLAMVGGRVATDPHTATVRDWYADWVRGGALLPVLRCGEQPYGVLPITHRPAEVPGAGDFSSLYEDRVTRFLSTWVAALPSAALDPDATDARPSGTAAGDRDDHRRGPRGGPAPDRVAPADATGHAELDMARLAELFVVLDSDARADDSLHPDHGTADAVSPILIAWRERFPGIFGRPDDDPPAPPPTIGAQLINLDVYRRDVADVMADVDAGLEVDGYEAIMGPTILRRIDDDVRPLLEFYDTANDAVPAVLRDWGVRAGLGDDDLVRFEGITYAADSVPLGDLVTTNGDVAEIRDLLVRAADALDRVAEHEIAPIAHDELLGSRTPAPLLAHLVDLTYQTVPLGDVGAVRVALGVLLAIVDSPVVVDAHAELERLLREALGPSLYRIDAWVTAIAAQRLAARRRARPAGLQVGGYGWLLDLHRSDDPVSQGFVHAPSMQHAASAAVLRSGWSAYGTARGEAPLSIDLSSARVPRRAVDPRRGAQRPGPVRTARGPPRAIPPRPAAR